MDIYANIQYSIIGIYEFTFYFIKFIIYMAPTSYNRKEWQIR